MHVLFWGTDKENTKGAMELRDGFINEFGLGNNERNCTMGPVDPAPTEPMCVFDADFIPSGPFLTAAFAFFIPRVDLQRAQQWMMLHHGVYDVLIHPNTGCHTQDHTVWAMWAGHKWDLDINVFNRHHDHD